MKKWFDYQMEHQVVDKEWAKYSRTISNINEQIKDIIPVVKEKYYRGDYDVYKRGSSVFTTEEYINNAGGLNLTSDEVREMIEDPEFAELMKNDGISMVGMVPTDEGKAITAIFAEHLGLKPELIGIHLNVQKPGKYFALHIDRVRLWKFADTLTTLNEEPIYRRHLLFADDWEFGQAFQLGDSFIKWSAGDVYTWNPRDVPHGSANFGFKDRFLFVISGIPKEQ